MTNTLQSKQRVTQKNLHDLQQHPRLCFFLLVLELVTCPILEGVPLPADPPAFGDAPGLSGGCPFLLSSKASSSSCCCSLMCSMVGPFLFMLLLLLLCWPANRLSKIPPILRLFVSSNGKLCLVAEFWLPAESTLVAWARLVPCGHFLFLLDCGARRASEEAIQTKQPAIRDSHSLDYVQRSFPPS